MAVTLIGGTIPTLVFLLALYALWFRIMPPGKPEPSAARERGGNGEGSSTAFMGLNEHLKAVGEYAAVQQMTVEGARGALGRYMARGETQFDAKARGANLG